MKTFIIIKGKLNKSFGQTNINNNRKTAHIYLKYMINYFGTKQDFKKKCKKARCLKTLCLKKKI